MRILSVAAVLLASLLLPAFTLGDTIFVNENFDSIGTALNATLPTDWRIQNYILTSDVRKVNTYASAGNQTTQAGSTLSSSSSQGRWNYGATSPTSDRAVGFLSSSSGTSSGNLYVTFSSGLTTATGLKIEYDVEKYRTGTNAAGFRFQMFYSPDGTTWTSGGTDFLTSFAADATTAGYPTAPGASVHVNKLLNLPLVANEQLYLAWNYSVSTGSTITSAQGLGIDNVKITGVAPVAPVAAVPTPSAVGGGFALFGLVVVARRWRLGATEPASD
jgi:hypothetical protein